MIALVQMEVLLVRMSEQMIYWDHKVYMHMENDVWISDGNMEAEVEVKVKVKVREEGMDIGCGNIVVISEASWRDDTTGFVL
jgi:hypothetical protein